MTYDSLELEEQSNAIGRVIALYEELEQALDAKDKNKFEAVKEEIKQAERGETFVNARKTAEQIAVMKKLDELRDIRISTMLRKNALKIGREFLRTPSRKNKMQFDEIWISVALELEALRIEAFEQGGDVVWF